MPRSSARALLVAAILIQQTAAIPFRSAQPSLSTDLGLYAHDGQLSDSHPIFEATEHAHGRFLFPAVPLHHNSDSTHHLKPQSSGQLYHTLDGSSDHRVAHEFALIEHEYSLPAVVIEHSNQVDTITCSSKGIRIAFSNPHAYAFAKRHWSSNFLIITHQDGCGSSIAGERTFWQVSHSLFDDEDMVAHEVATRREIQQVVKTSVVSWGIFEPRAEPALGVNYTCPQPPSANSLGFQTAPLCDDFDQILDDQIGYLDFSADTFASSLERFLPGLEDYSYEAYGGPAGIPEKVENTSTIAFNGTISGLRRRQAPGRDTLPLCKGFNFLNCAKTLFNSPLVQAVPSAARAIPATGVVVVSTALNVANAAAPPNLKSAIPTFDPRFDRKVDKPINYTYTPEDATQETRWGMGKKLFGRDKPLGSGKTEAEITLSCVDCRLEAELNVAGRLKIDFTRNLVQAANLAVTGRVAVQAYLALEASVAYTTPFNKRLVTVPLPLAAFGVPGVFTIGPSIGVDAKGSFGLKAAGGVIVGGRAEQKALAISVDLLLQKATQSGLIPEFSRRLEAYGEISTSTRLGLPIILGCGISIPAIDKGGKGTLVAITNEASVFANATYAVSTNASAFECNNGVNWVVGVDEEVKFKLAGFNEASLFKTNLKNATGCYNLGRNTTIANTTSPVSPAVNATIPGAQNVPAKRSLRARQATEEDPSGINSTDVPPDVTDEQAYDLIFAETEEVLESSEDPAQNVALPEGSFYLPITSKFGDYFLGYGENGNFYLSDAGTNSNPDTFIYTDGVMFTPDGNQIFHYYNDTMSQLGVSRFRISDLLDMPITADFVTLTSYNTDYNNSTRGDVVPLTLDGQVFYTVLCEYVDESDAQVFLVRDIETGIQRLQSPELTYIVTGGNVSECFFWPFQTTLPGLTRS